MRLTKRDRGGNAVMACDTCEIKYRESCCSLYQCRNALIDKLAAYEDAEEQGLLVRLPCKVGAVIWRVWHGKIDRYVVVEVDAQDHVKLRFLMECLPYLRFYWDDEYGKTVFLTRKAAEAALKGE